MPVQGDFSQFFLSILVADGKLHTIPSELAPHFNPFGNKTIKYSGNALFDSPFSTSRLIFYQTAFINDAQLLVETCLKSNL